MRVVCRAGSIYKERSVSIYHALVRIEARAESRSRMREVMDPDWLVFGEI